MTDQSRFEASRLRDLPERPSLEHLKNEAKSRLKSRRGTDPSAKLASIQRELAREYGFSSWSQLRARVVSMEGGESPIREDAIARLRYEQAKPRHEVTINPASLDRLVGYYELGPNNVFSVMREGDGLIVKLGSQPFFAVAPESERKFFYRNPSIQAQITFGGEHGKKATALVLHQHGREMTAKRVAEDAATRAEKRLQKRRTENAPAQGSEAAIHRLVQEILADEPNCEFMQEGLAREFRQQHRDNRRQMREWGELISVEFKAVSRDGESDVYDVRFAGCRTEWRIGMSSADKVDWANYRPYP